MALDWGILHWIQNNISCPFLDAVVPKLTMLGNAGIIWILAGVLLLCTKKYRRQGALVLHGSARGTSRRKCCAQASWLRARGPAGSIPPCSF